MELLAAQGCRVSPDVHPNEVLLRVVQLSGDTENLTAIVELLLDPQVNADISYKDEKGLSALHVAAARGRMGVLRHILRDGSRFIAQVDDPITDGQTALHLAANDGHI